MSTPKFDDFSESELTIEERIRAFTKKYGIGQRALARIIGISVTYLQSQIKGYPSKKSPVQQYTIDRINEHYGTNFTLDPKPENGELHTPPPPDGPDGATEEGDS